MWAQNLLGTHLGRESFIAHFLEWVVQIWIESAWRKCASFPSDNSSAAIPRPYQLAGLGCIW